MADAADATISDTSDTPTPEPEADDRKVPLAALEAERAKRQAIADELAAIKAAQEQAERERAEQAGEFQRLYEGLQPQFDELKTKYDEASARLAAVEEARKARQARRIEALPESARALVPEGMSGDALDAHLDKLEAFKPPTAPQGGLGGPSGRNQGGGPDAEELTKAEREWAEAKGHIAKGLKPATIRKLYRKFGPGADQ